MDIGLTLEEQLRDDPAYANAPPKDFKKAIKKFQDDYLKPLECIDKYLRQFKREGEYKSISAGKGDREGRWQAFIDWSNSYHTTFQNRSRLNDLGIEEDEIGIIEEAAFDVIRLREIQNMPKVHTIMRNFPKYCGTKDGKKEIKKIADEIKPVLPPDKCVDEETGNSLTPEKIDIVWAAENRQKINYHVKKAADIQEQKKEKLTPLELLEAAYKKLTHEDMELNRIDIAHHNKARRLVVKIKECAEYMEDELYHFKKAQKKLNKKK